MQKVDEEEYYRLRLYVAGQTPKSLQAFSNLRQICEEHLRGRYQIEVIDLLENSQLAKGDQILAIPALVRKLPAVGADPSQMFQLFQNLISNGLKFQRNGDLPLIDISARTSEGTSAGETRWKIRVKDNGIGFEEAPVEKIFKPFERLHGRGHGYEGVGMRLAICRKVVERHRGSITAKSAPEKGSRFIVTLPERQPVVDQLC